MSETSYTPVTGTTELKTSTSATGSWTGEEVFSRVCKHYDDIFLEDPELVHKKLGLRPTVEAVFIIDESVVGFPFCKEDFKLQLTPEQIAAAIEHWRLTMVQAVNEVARRYQDQVQKDNGGGEAA